MSNSISYRNKAVHGMSYMLSAVKELGLNDVVDFGDICLNDHPTTGETSSAIYIDGVIYDLYNDPTSKFRTLVDQKFEDHGLYLEAYTYGIFLVEEA